MPSVETTESTNHTVIAPADRRTATDPPPPPAPPPARDPETSGGELAGLGRAMRANGWTPWHLVAMAGLIALGVGLTYDGWADLLHLAIHDEESSQILLVPAVIAWLLWVRRDRLAGVAPGFSLIGPAFIVLGWAVWEYGYYESVRVNGHIAAVALLAGAIVSVTGGRLFWRLLPVFGVLIFAIPVPYRIRMPISMPLQRITAQIAEHLVQVFGVDITRHGSVLVINGVEVGVAEACNGMRMVFAVFLVTYLFVFMTPMRLGMRLLILALCPLLALACNIFRVVPTIFFYGYTTHDIAETFHDLSGWLMIGVVFMVLIGMVNLIRWMMVEDDEPRVAVVRATEGK